MGARVAEATKGAGGRYLIQHSAGSGKRLLGIIALILNARLMLGSDRVTCALWNS